MQKSLQAAKKTIALLRRPLRAKLLRTSGLAQALSEKATRGHRLYKQ
jgi:hypothetical protein